MAQATKDQKRSRNPQNKHKSTSHSQPKTHYSHANESKISISKKKMFLFVKLKELGCKGTSLPVSTPGIIRSAAEWEEYKGARNKNQKRRKQLDNRRNHTANNNVVVDVNHVCCKPPGIGIASDFVPRTRNPAPRKHSREARRNEDESGPDFPAVLSSGIGSRANHRSAGEIIEILMSRQTLQPGRIFQQNDLYQNWRFNMDDMSYEELLDLSERIGYVDTGLQEEEISSCLRKSKHFKLDNRDWKCSICQEKHRDDDIGTLDCGHHHHLECIKQWLQQKNACPVCKSAAMRDRSK